MAELSRVLANFRDDYDSAETKEQVRQLRALSSEDRDELLLYLLFQHRERVERYMTTHQ